MVFGSEIELATPKFKSQSDIGRPKGKLSSVTKLTGKDDLIREYLQRNIPQTVIARLLNVNRRTVRNYIVTRKLTLS